MTDQELKQLIEAKNKEVADVYSKKCMELMMDVYEKGIKVGIEIGKSICRFEMRMIPVEERLPLESLCVLCRMKSNGQIVSGYLYKKDGKVCVATDANFEFEDYGGDEATHWFPLFDVMCMEETK